jgi:hypothetical protein
MISARRVVFRQIDAQSDEAERTEQVSLPGPGKLLSLSVKGRSMTAGEGNQYRVRLYHSPPGSSCWFAEVVAPTLGADERTADTLHQGLELVVTPTFWITYEILNARLGQAPTLTVDLLLDQA